MMRSRTPSDTPPLPKRSRRRLTPTRVTPYQLRARTGPRQSTREAARVLLREYHEHGDLQARERLIQQYMPLVKSLARRHSSGGELYEDLVQVGCIGLIKAVDRFDPRRAEFGAFVIPNVAGEIKRYLRDRAWPVRVPRRLQELRPGLCACSAELSAQFARPATISEIADRSGIAEREVEAALDAERVRTPLSLSDARKDDEATCDLDVLEGGFERGEQRALLAAGFRVLDERERRLLHLRYFEGLSQPQIAELVGISTIHVSRLTRGALAKLRDEIGPMHSPPAYSEAIAG
jgi:RNA polymerase sigma-B factor